MVVLSCVRTHEQPTSARDFGSTQITSPGPCRVECFFVALILRGLPTTNKGGLQQTRPIDRVPHSDKEMQGKNREEAFKKQLLYDIHIRRQVRHQPQDHSECLDFTPTGITAKYEELNCLCPGEVGVLYVSRHPEISLEYLRKLLQTLRTSPTSNVPQFLKLLVRLVQRRNAKLNSGWLFQNRKFCSNLGDTRFRIVCL